MNLTYLEFGRRDLNDKKYMFIIRVENKLRRFDFF